MNCRVIRKLSLRLFPIAGLFWGVINIALATFMEDSVNTSPLASTASQPVFYLMDGDLAVNNSVTFTNLTTDSTHSVESSLGGGTGTLAPEPLTISDTDIFNEFFPPITLAYSISCTLVLMANNTPLGFFPDQFSFFINSRQQPFLSASIIRYLGSISCGGLFAN